VLNGFWLEEHAPEEAPGFAAALARSLAQFATFLNARRVDLTVLESATLCTQVQEHIDPALENVEVRLRRG